MGGSGGSGGVAGVGIVCEMVQVYSECSAASLTVTGWLVLLRTDFPPLSSHQLSVLLPLQSNMKVLTICLVLASVGAQFEEEEELYRGQLIGSLNSYHHQVSSVTTTVTNM